MDAHVRDALVSDFEDLISRIRLPDPDDRHVVAAAMRGGANIILTANLKDFPASEITPHGLAARHPDTFLADLCRETPGPFLEAMERVRARLRNPPLSNEDHFEALRQAGLNATVAEVLAARSSMRPQPRTACHRRRGKDERLVAIECGLGLG